MMRRWLGPRARASRVRVRQAAWGVVVVATVIILAWTGQEKLQSLATRWDLDPPTAMAGAHAEGAASTSLLMQASKPEDAAGAAGPTAMPGPVHERPMETPPFVAPSAPETEEAGRQDLDRNDGSGAVEQEAGGWDEDAEASAMDDDDSHELFAEELKVGDDDDEAVVVRPRSPAAPKTEGEQDLDRNDGSGEVDQEAGGREDASPVDDDDSHELFAEELREDDDDDEAVVVRPRSPAAPAAAATTTASSSSSSMTVSECVANYGTRHFLRDDQPTAPPILYSFPGKRDSIPPNH